MALLSILVVVVAVVLTRQTPRDWSLLHSLTECKKIVLVDEH